MRQRHLVVFTLLLLIALPAMSHAESVQSWWLERSAVPEGIATAAAQRFLIDRLPVLQMPETPEAWNDYAGKLRRSLLEEVYLEGVPDAWRATRLGLVWGERIEHPSYIIHKLRYEAVPGLWIPAVLYEPRTEDTPIPAVLNVNGHSYDQGKADKAEQIRCATLAANGVLALHPEWYACGELNGPGFAHANIALLDVLGVRGVSLFYFAMKRALDVLMDCPRTDSARVAMTGLSGGGWQTAVLSALDERITLTTPVAGHGGMKPRIEALYDLGDLEQVPTGFLAIADYPHLTALFAPRPALLVYNQRDECCFLPERALPTTYEAALPVYEVLGASQNLAFHINENPGTHNYERDNRAQFFRFLGKHFLGGEDAITESPKSEAELHEKEALYVGLPEDNANFITLAEGMLAGRTLPSPPKTEDTAFIPWQRQQRERLEAVVRPQRISLETRLRQSLSAGALRAYRYELRSASWTLGALHLVPEGADTSRLTLLISDGGMADHQEMLDRDVVAQTQILACDPIFMGANMPNPLHSDALAMVFNAGDATLLGVQAGQVAALCAWAHNELHAEHITLRCVGWNAAVAGLIACHVLHDESLELERLDLADAPESLSALITGRVKYPEEPALFCYGFLLNFDIPQLIAGCHPTPCSLPGPAHAWQRPDGSLAQTAASR